MLSPRPPQRSQPSPPPTSGFCRTLRKHGLPDASGGGARRGHDTQQLPGVRDHDGLGAEA